MTEDSNNFEEKWKQLVVERVNAGMSANLKLSIGMGKSFNKEEVLEHVRKGDEIGQQVINMHKNFMQAQVSGQFTNALNSV
ncbi:MAG: hypothetical protein V1889_03195 [archaeon]